MRAFVAGATGYVGSALVPLLVERGIETVAHVRPNSSKLAHFQELFGEQGATVDTSAWEEGAIAAAIGELQPELVFGCLGTTRARKRTSEDPANETYLAIDYGLTSMLRGICAAMKSPPLFVYLSSAGVRAGTGNAYIEARWKLESELRDGDMPYLIAQPAFISGDNRGEHRPMERAGAVVGDTLLGMAGAIGFGGFRDRWASLTNEQLAAGLVEFALSDVRNATLDPAHLRDPKPQSFKG